MSKIGLMIAASARLGSGYAERLLKDVTPEHFARLAVSGQQVVDSNHPAFIYGHLSLYAPRIVSELGGDASSMQPTELFELRFSKDATCVDEDGQAAESDVGPDEDLRPLRAAEVLPAL